MGFTKLFSEIVMSTVWREPNHVRIVWITMLALRDRWSMVEASLPGLADAARVSMPECEEALRVLSSPDPYSRTTADEGRRIKRVEGGWFIINGEKYRNKMSLDERRDYQRIKAREYRARDKALENQGPSTECRQNGPRLTQTETETETETEKSKATSKAVQRAAKSRSASLTDDQFLEGLKVNPTYKGIDIDRELGKMDAWLSTKPGRVKSRRFIVNWLNKIERPVEGKKGFVGQERYTNALLSEDDLKGRRA